MSNQPVSLADGRSCQHTGREHTNHEGQGFCCPHCYKSMESDLYRRDDAVILNCENCDEPFAIWTEVEIVNASGFIDMDELED